ncbi:MAG: hypothetical protein IJE02_02190 [Clostridia bacterium]|nr:hypothetical protein [Clostridia bacterium]
MVQNLKVDIIYHSTPSDFEMEFNLCGCCRMRLLSDKTNDKKGFVKALARDVSRSRIIIACGPIFGNDGLISVVATAIGSGVSLCDNKTYGINSDEKIHIINGSTPLVTPDGYFGGCIIESGPQTIIVLTENRAFRKSIMQTLIHPYIEEISYIPMNTISTAPAEPEQEFEAAVNEGEEYVTTDEDYVESAEEPVAQSTPAEDEHNIEFVMDEEDETVNSEVDLPSSTNSTVFADDQYSLMYTDVETEEEVQSRYSDPYKPSESDNMFISISDAETDETGTDKVNQRKLQKMDITIVILVLLLLLAILALIYFIVLRPVSAGVSTGDYIKQIFGVASNSSLV